MTKAERSYSSVLTKDTSDLKLQIQKNNARVCSDILYAKESSVTSFWGEMYSILEESWWLGNKLNNALPRN